MEKPDKKATIDMIYNEGYNDAYMSWEEYHRQEIDILKRHWVEDDRDLDKLADENEKLTVRANEMETYILAIESNLYCLKVGLGIIEEKKKV